MATIIMRNAFGDIVDTTRVIESRDPKVTHSEAVLLWPEFEIELIED